MQKNKKTAFLGFGELAEQIISYLDLNSKDVVIYDDSLNSLKENAFSFNEFEHNISSYKWVVALGYKHLEKKLELLELITVNKGELISFIDKSCFISSKSFIGPGVFIYPMCNIDKGVEVGMGTLLNNSVVVSHDCKIGKGNYLSPGVTLSGNVKIGNSNFIGTGTIISDSVSIGDNVIIAAGTLVTKDVPSNSRVIGNPMQFKDNIKLR